MKRKIIATLIILFVFCLVIGLASYSSTLVAGYNNTTNYSKEELNTLIEEKQSIKENAHNMAESARALGWEEDSDLILELKEKWVEADEEQQVLQSQLNQILQAEEEAAITAQQAEEEKWAVKAAEYPVATQIWRYMKAQGWNDYVCAGIMGNIMAEVGGQTLNIRYTLSSGNYYGMCQWSRTYSKVWGTGLETQCDFLRDTIHYEFDTYGFKYQKGFNFNSFLNMTDAQQAALAFAKSYERCGSGSYGVRQKNALKAYNYFVG